MTAGRLSGLLLLAVVGLAGACGGPPEGGEEPAGASPSTTPEEAPLTATDVETYLAVRGHALDRLESSVDELVEGGGDVATKVQELSTEERQAARSMSVDWLRYSWVREEVARLLAVQRQEADAALLQAELERARDELKSQLQVARDRASREFLEAQLKSLDTQLEKLKQGRNLSPRQAERMRLLDNFRAQLAMQQGRLERIQKRIRDLVRASRSEPTPEQSPAKR
jgi:hypothetical protein